MASNIQPTGLDWKNLPDKTTPISAENLNKMANTIDDLVEAVNPLNTVEANPEGTPTEGLEKVEIDGTLYEVKGGHKILNDSGTTLTQKDNLQFKGVYTQNNGDNTEVDICRTMTKAQMEALSGESLKGFINTSDEPDSLPLTAEWVGYGNGSVKDGLDNKVSKTGDTMTGNLTVNRANSSTSNLNSVITAGNNIPVGTVGSSRGVLTLYSYSDKQATIYPEDLTADRYVAIPNKTGTMALTSDLVQYKDNTFSGLTNSDNTKYYINLTTDFYTALGIPSNKIVIGVTVLNWSSSNKTPPVLAIDGTALAWVFPVGCTFTNAQIKVRIAYF